MRSVLLSIVLLTLPGVFLFVSSKNLPDIEMRPSGAAPSAWIGSLDDGALPRQRFRTPSDGLWRIDVALQQGPGPKDVRLVLLDGETPVRTAIGEHGTVRDLNFGFTTFEFEPLEDSGGRELAFELRAPQSVTDGRLGLAPRLRSRRMRGNRPQWTADAHELERVTGMFLSSRDALAGLSFFAAQVTPGNLHFELTELDGTPVRRIDETLTQGFEGGMLLVPFEPLNGSREHVYRWSLEPPDGTQLRLAELALGDDAPILTAIPGHFHGALRDDPQLLGASGLGWPAGEADILFATFAEKRDVWTELRERMGARLYAAAALWVGACLALVALLRSARLRAQNAKSMHGAAPTTDAETCPNSTPPTAVDS